MHKCKAASITEELSQEPAEEEEQEVKSCLGTLPSFLRHKKEVKVKKRNLGTRTGARARQSKAKRLWHRQGEQQPGAPWRSRGHPELVQ